MGQPDPLRCNDGAEVGLVTHQHVGPPPRAQCDDMRHPVSSRATREALTDQDLEYLRDLPLIERIDDDTTLSHATIYDAHAFDYIQTQYDAHLSLQELQTTCGFVGHSHIPISFYLKDGAVSWTMEPTFDLSECDYALVNVGSVGQPRDENPQAAYAVFDTEKRKVWIKRVDYDVDAAVEAIEKNNLPRILGERLRLGK